MTQEHLTKERLGPVLTLTLNRSHNLNVFNPDMLIGLTFAIHNALKNPDVKVIVLVVAGCLETDCNKLDHAYSFRAREHSYILNECILTIKKSAKPIIASVHGFIAEAGFGLTFASDMIVAAEESKFSFNLFMDRQDDIPTSFLTRLIGPYLANLFIKSREPISAASLYQIGAVNYLAPFDKLQEETTRLALKLANVREQAFSMLKNLLDHSLTTSLEELLKQERFE